MLQLRRVTPVVILAMISMQFGGPFVIQAGAQRRQKSEATLHGVATVDFHEIYDSSQNDDSTHDKSHKELRVMYDITKDFHIVGDNDLAEMPDKPAVVHGTFHAQVESSTAGGKLHMERKMDVSGAIAEGGLDFRTNGPGSEDISILSDRVKSNCKATGNMHQDPDECDAGDLSDVQYSKDEHGEKIVYVEQTIQLRPQSERPTDLDQDEEYTAKAWYGGQANAGNLASGFSVTMSGRKIDDEPNPSDPPSYKAVRQKTVSISIKVTPAGKTALVPAAARPYSPQRTSYIRPDEELESLPCCRLETADLLDEDIV